MKIVRTIESFFPFMTGPAKEAFMIATRLEANGISSPIYTTYYNAFDEADEETMQNVNIKRFKADFSFMRYIITRGMKKELIKEDFDIYHAHNYRSYQTDAALKASEINKKPFVLSAHGSITGYKSSVEGLKQWPYKLYDLLTGMKALKKADTIIVNSRGEYEEAVQHGVEESKLKILPFGIDVANYKTKRKDKEKLTLLFVGNISRNRNLEPVIKAMKHIDKRFSLRIVGEEMQSSSTLKPGYIEELKELAKEKGVKKRVEFAGAKYGPDLTEEYKNADVFIYTSLSENFGQTILEAGAAGLPLVITPVGIGRDLVQEGKTGYLVDFDDPKGIAEKVNNLQEFKKRKYLGNSLQNYIEDNFSWEEIMMEYEKMYLELAKKYNLVS